ETLRMWPLVPEVMRTLKRPFEIDERYQIPAGSTVSASITLAHRDPDTWPDPLAFKPERFEGKTFSPSVYLPFGGGIRRCIGAAFALYEMRIFLATFLTGADLALVEDREVLPVRRQLTLGPDSEVPLKKRARAGAARAA